MSGTTPSGLNWTAVATGTALPIRTSNSPNGQAGAVASFNTRNGQMQIDPKGLNLSLFNLAYTTGTTDWNTTATDWSGNATRFVNGDDATFSNSSGGTVTLSGTLEPGAFVVSATAGTYTFTGGAGNLIAGSTSLAKSGAGVAVFTSANDWTGGTNLTGGTNHAGADRALGTGTLSLAGGTLTPGNSPGLLSVASLDLLAGSATLMQIVGAGSSAGTAGSDYDKVMIFPPDAPFSMRISIHASPAAGQGDPRRRPTLPSDACGRHRARRRGGT